MGRERTMYARAARRADRELPLVDRANGTGPFDPKDLRCTCPYCGFVANTVQGKDRHINLRPYCRSRHEDALRSRQGCEQKRKWTDEVSSTPEVDEASRKRTRVEVDTPPVAGPSQPRPRTFNPGHTAGRYARNGLFVKPFPISTAGTPIGEQRRNEADLQEYLQRCGWLGDCDMFDTGYILMTTGLSGMGRSTHLKGPMYKKGGCPWKDNTALLRDVDKLPTGPEWKTADVSAGEGSHRRAYTVHFRDVLEVVRELISARRFKEWMRYAPERHWTSKHGGSRVYDEMWSGDWWWRMQHLIRDKNGMVVPLIIASDKTTLTKNPKGGKAHPVYLSIGNVSKTMRRKPSKRAMVIIGYLPVDSFEGFPNKLRRRYRTELLHRSLEKIFEPLKTVSSDRIDAWCADGYLHHIYPIIAAWIADLPEQHNIACTTHSGCPKCLHKWKGRSQGGPSAPLREQDVTLEAIRTYRETKQATALNVLCLQPVTPFWADIPHVDIGGCMAPDLLHQLYKGMFEHARDWAEELLGTREFNQRFKSMPRAKDLRYFRKGVTKVKVWRGRESRDMMRQLLPVVLDAQAPLDFVRMIRALLDFSYLAHGAQLTDDELTEMDNALVAFHKAKYVLIALKTYTKRRQFNQIPKLHMVGHYPNDIRELGAPDGFSTETPEHLHIVYVKIPWSMSNRRDPMPQVVDYVRRIEALEIQRTLIDEYYGDGDEIDLEDDEIYGDDQDESESNVGEEEIGGDESDEDDEGDMVQVASEEMSEPERSEIYYPRPVRSIAKQPTIPRVPGHVLISSYHATDLIQALRRFLLPIAQRRGEDLILLPSDHFNVWHKLTLDHSCLPFAPNQLCHRDVVRAHPAVWDATGRVTTAGVFDTVLFSVDPEGIGLNRYRAGRVRAMFTLPPSLQHLYPYPLAYVEFFTPFVPDATSHRLYRTSQAYLDGHRAFAAFPLSWIVMACYIAPDFSSSSTPAGRFDISSPAYTGRDFVFNDFYNYFTYLLMAYWQRSVSTRLS